MRFLITLISLLALLFSIAPAQSALSTTKMQLLKNFCKDINLLHSHLSSRTCLTWGVNNFIDWSAQNRPILTFDALPKKRTSKTFKILLIGGMSGDDTTSINTLIKWAKRLLNQPPNQHWRVLPFSNPDSVVNLVHTNSNGVDINNNFPSSSNKTPLEFWQNNSANKLYFPGKKSLNQVESKFIHEQIERFSPNLIITLQGSYGSINFAGPSGVAPKKLYRLKRRISPPYPGSLKNYAWGVKGIPTLSIKLNKHSTFPLGEHYLWLYLLNWIETTYQTTSSISIDDRTLLEQALSALSKNKLEIAKKLLVKISSPNLSEIADNNLAYIHTLQNNRLEAKKLWEKNTLSKKENISTVALNNLHHLSKNTDSGTDDFYKLLEITLMYPPIETKQVKEQLTAKIKEMIFSSIIKDDEYFTKIFINAPQPIQSNSHYALVNNFSMSISLPLNSALTDFEVNWQSTSGNKLDRYRLSWKKMNKNWLISNIIRLTP